LLKRERKTTRLVPSQVEQHTHVSNSDKLVKLHRHRVDIHAFDRQNFPWKHNNENSLLNSCNVCVCVKAFTKRF